MVVQKPRNPRDYLFNVDFVKYMEILSAQWGFVLAFTASAVLTSLALTYLFSETYRADTAIYYRPVDTTLLRQKNSETFGAPAPQAPFKIIVQTLNDIVKSEAVIRPVVEELHLDQEMERKYDSWYQEWFNESKRVVKEFVLDIWEILKHGRLIEESPTQKTIAGLSEAISLQSTKDSYIYVLSVKDRYPDRAAKIVDAVGAQLVLWSRQQDQGPSQVKRQHLAEEITAKESEIAAMRRERDEILHNNSIVSIAEEVTTGIQNQYNLKIELERIAAQANEKQKRLEEIERLLATRENRYIDPDHVKRLEEEKLFAEIELKALGVRRASLQRSVEQMLDRMQYVLSVKKQFEDMDARIEKATRESHHISDMHVEANEGAQGYESEVKILHAAAVPSKPIQPIKIYHVGLTGLLALFFSIGLVYVFSYFNVRVFFHSSRPPSPDDPVAHQESNRG